MNRASGALGFERIALALAAAAMVVSGVAARQRGEDLGVSVVFGWQGKMPAQRWAPITVSIAPGESALAGEVVAEYHQGAAGRARFSVPFAATPHTTTPVHVLVALPESCGEVSLTITDDAGQPRWRQRFESIGPTSGQAMPPLLGPESPLVAFAGRGSFVEAMRDWPTIMAASDFAMSGDALRPAFRTGPTDAGWARVIAARAEESDLPGVWVAYDGLSLLVVQPESTADPRSIEAVHTWVASGGRLVVRADTPGETWRAWVPDSLAAGLDLGSLRSAPTPPRVREAIAAMAGRLRAIKDSADGGGGITGIDGALPTPAETIMVRPIRGLTPDWDILWPDLSSGGGVIAAGRWGFGSVLVLGFDPARTMQAFSTAGAGAVWRAAMEPVAGDILEAATRPYDRPYASVPMSSQSAVNTGLERVADVPGVGASVFVVIAACVFGLALLVGPVDFFGLRRLALLHRSWLTALVWVAVSSIAAFLGPRVLRTETTRVNRITVEDCFALPMEGSPSASRPAVAFRSGLTGLYAGESGVARLEGCDPTSWWRGTSVRYDYSDSGGAGITPIVQRAAGGAAGSQRGGPLRELPLALWTFRTFADESTPAPTLRARLRPGDKGVTVLVSGLPVGVSVVNAALRTGDRWLTPRREARLRRGSAGYDVADSVPSGQPPEELGSVDGGVWAAVFPAEFADAAPPFAWGAAETYSGGVDDGWRQDTRPGPLLQLWGPSRRTHSIEELVASGAWAAIYLEVRRWPAETLLTWNFEGEHTRILRVLTPIDSAGEDLP